jgi:hypothetical protein
MIKIPTTVIDDFFDKPDQILDYGLNLEFKKDPEGRWPGTRTQPLHEINPPLFKFICNKIISIYFDLDGSSEINWVANCTFQKVNKYYKSGWIHTDEPMVFTNIIYLNKNPNINSGTSIYKLKNNIIIPNSEFTEHKIKAYKDLVPIETIEEKRKESNDQYVEVVRVHNEYNRILSFDSNLPHAAHNFFGEDDEEPRLTLNVFFSELRVTKTPIDRIKTSIY